MWTYKLFNNYRVESDGSIYTFKAGMVIIVDLYFDDHFSGLTAKAYSPEQARDIGQGACDCLNKGHN